VQNKIDFVITWVDGNDPEWKRKKQTYISEQQEQNLSKWNDSSARYRDWDLLRYWFRGVEKFAPWVNCIHFVTCGQKPEWINEKHPKLNLVSHTDYIPKQYLPTFNSHCIELNFHRIPQLAEQFVYFNDDMFLLQPVQSELFFKNGLPCGTAIMRPVQMVQNGIRAEINDLYVINRYFEKNKVLKDKPSNWFSLVYGKTLLSTIFMLPFDKINGFHISHMPTSLQKSTIETVWKKEKQLLDYSCQHRFRNSTDVNQWLFEYWQYCSNKFVPRSPKSGKMFEGASTHSDMCEAIRKQQYKMICCNDSIDICDFDRAKEELQKAFESILPVKSSFEK